MGAKSIILKAFINKYHLFQLSFKFKFDKIVEFKKLQKDKGLYWTI